MLFSDPEVTSFVNDRFVCAWESVRPVPKVDIDFGNGHTLRRTLNGNVVTYLCTPEGKVFDILPGLHSPEGYLAGLRRALDLNDTMRSAAQLPSRPRSLAVAAAAPPPPPAEQAQAFERAIAAYHSLEARGVESVAVFAGGGVRPAAMAFASKARVETPIKVLLSGRPISPEEAFRLEAASIGARPSAPAPQAVAKSRLESPIKRSLAPEPPEDPLAEGLDAKALLEMDTRINERLRKEKVHALLSQAPLPAPAEIRATVYKEIFHLDLEDSYLGLAPLLFGGAEGPRG
ncbi:MAG TPA: hypothetical protein VKF62_13345 [Planctomycetota bacterium]|nr:hypothetical protein [Planctomycetota bacterium]